MLQTEPPIVRIRRRRRLRARVQLLFLVAVAATLVCGCQSGSATSPTSTTISRAAPTSPPTTAQATTTLPPTSIASTTAPPAAATMPEAVVRGYVDAINAHDYVRAWRLGGSNLGASYSTFAAGFTDTIRDSLTILLVDGDTVHVRLVARQTGGQRTTYEGRYIVRHGKIVAASLHKVASSSSPSAPIGRCSARVKFARPGDGGSETVYVNSDVPRSPVTATIHYKTKDTSYQRVTGVRGAARITFGIGHPTRGYSVEVDVAVDGKAFCSTSFTPH
jgi:hypothetical protein